MKTQCGLTVVTKHEPEGSDDFVKVTINYDIDPCRLYLQPDEAVELATDLLRYARIAKEAHSRYLEGRK